MGTLTIVLRHPPYVAGSPVGEALRLAGAALAEDLRVRLHLLDAAVELARRGHRVPEGAQDLEALLEELMACGLEVQACGLALDARGLDEAELIPGVARGSMRALVAWLRESDQVLSF